MIRYEKGFPEEIVIGEGGMSVNDVERLMLSLDGEKSLMKYRREWLMGYYTKERQKYLDERYEMTPERRNRLLEVERMMWKSRDEIEPLCKLHVERELRKQKRGIRIPTRIGYHLEVGNTEVEGLSDVEIDLFNLLCAEDRYCSHWWGYEYSYYDFERGQYVLRRRQEEARQMDQDGFTYGFHSLKDNYGLAWQDMERITCFWLTVDYCYDKD